MCCAVLCCAVLCCAMVYSVESAFCLQAGTSWRKASAKLEGEPEFEDLSKIDRLEAFDDYMK